MVHEFTERLFGGGGGKRSLTTPKRPGTGRWAGRKTPPYSRTSLEVTKGGEKLE